jgi:hypothetical protein
VVGVKGGKGRGVEGGGKEWEGRKGARVWACSGERGGEGVEDGREEEVKRIRGEKVAFMPDAHDIYIP